VTLPVVPNSSDSSRVTFNFKYTGLIAISLQQLNAGPWGMNGEYVLGTAKRYSRKL